MLFLQIWMSMFWILLIEGSYRIWRLKSKTLVPIIDILAPRAVLFVMVGLLAVVAKVTFKAFSV